MSNEETQNIENTVGVQLGSDSKKLAKGEVDIDRLGYITQAERLPMAWFKRTHKYLGKQFLDDLFRDYQNLGVGVDGLGRRQLIQVIGASRGINSTQTVEKPGLLTRIMNPGWREKLAAEGYEVRES